MKKAFLFLLVTVSAGFILTIQSCKEKENQAPVVTVDEPVNGETISLGDSIHIEFTAIPMMKSTAKTKCNYQSLREYGVY